MISGLENFLTQLLSTVDITGSINLGVTGAMFLLTMLSEVYIQIPFLIESVWLALGYQSMVNGTAALNTALVFLIASIGRQATMNTLYYTYDAIDTPLSRLYTAVMQKNKRYKRYIENENLYAVRYLSLPSVVLGMLTWLSGPIKFVLIVRRKHRTLFSGMAFDAIYLVMGAVFQKTPLQLTYLPVLLFVGLLVFLLVRLKVAK